MIRPHEHSVPPSQPAPFRHLGTGSRSSLRSTRFQIVLVVALVFLAGAVPLYLFRPRATPVTAADAAAASSSAPPPAAPVDSTASLIAAALDGGVSTPEVTIGKVWVDACKKPGPGRTPASECDRQPFFEEALVKAVIENAACAPKRRNGGTLSYALRVDYAAKRLKLFAGRSGSLKGRAARPAIQCVERALPQPDWDKLEHLHTSYLIGVLATYPPAAP